MKVYLAGPLFTAYERAYIGSMGQVCTDRDEAVRVPVQWTHELDDAEVTA